MHIFAIANQKGGVGKTTTAVNFSAALAQQGQRVLLVDIDPQGNATMGCGVDKNRLHKSVYHLLLGLAEISEARRSFAQDSPSGQSTVGGSEQLSLGEFHIWPANRELAGAEVELVDLEERETRLRKLLAQVRDKYDFVLIDCPPSLSMLTLNALCAAHGVIVPMQCEYYALEGLTDLVNTIKRVHGSLNNDLKIIGLLRVMFDSRSVLSQQVSSQLEARFHDKVFRSIVPRNVRLAEAPSYGIPGVLYDAAARGAVAYQSFAREMIERVKTL